MRLTLFGLWLLALPLFASESVSLRNDREGSSFYSSRADKRAISKALRRMDSTQILRAFDETLRQQDINKLCSFDFNAALQEKLKAVEPDFQELDGAILYLRSQDEIDDTVTKILLKAHIVISTDLLLPKRREELRLPARKVVEEALIVLKSADRKLSSTCLEESYRSVYGDILKFNKELSSSHLEAIFVEAYEQKVISYQTYLLLEKARINDLETSGLTLKAYYRKIKSLRTQFPLRDSFERSAFVTEQVDKVKVSRRQRLLESYTDLQIMLMANVIKKLRTRLESPRAEILIYDRSNGVETIELEPMERFRLAIKLLRKENSLLALNTYFAGRAPDYMDLMTAAYEVGIIPASELEEVAGLEEIWNPTKSFWEKASVWVRTLSSVATVTIPPPYGFIPALAVVVIEMTAGKKDNNSNDPTVLF